MNNVLAAYRTWSHYQALRDHVIALARSLDDAQLEAVVPMCPAWSVHDVIAHVTGLNADLTGGMTEGLGSDERTAHQVSVRSGTAIDDICDEWAGYDAGMAAICEQTPLWAVRLAADLTVHLHDIQQALGLPIDRTDRFTAAAARQYASVCRQRAHDIAGVSITIEFTDGTPVAVDAPRSGSHVTLRATPFDFLRSFTGRRSRRQVESLDWTGDPSRILDAAWSPYGSFRPDDVID